MTASVDPGGPSGSQPTVEPLVPLPVWPALWLTVVLATAVAMGEVNGWWPTC